MADIRRLGRPAEEALDLEVQAEVRRRDGQPVGERRNDTLVEEPWHRIQAGYALGGERRVPSEQLVAPVASQCDGDGLAREPREHVRRQDRRIRERLVENVDDRRQDVDQRSGVKICSWWSVPKCWATRRACADSSKLRSLEPDRERLDVPRRHLLDHHRHDRARVDPAAQEGAERDVAHQAAPHRLTQTGVELLGVLVGVDRTRSDRAGTRGSSTARSTPAPRASAARGRRAACGHPRRSHTAWGRTRAPDSATGSRGRAPSGSPGARAAT